VLAPPDENSKAGLVCAFNPSERRKKAKRKQNDNMDGGLDHLPLEKLKTPSNIRFVKLRISK
jgi:hypothetical protein